MKRRTFLKSIGLGLLTCVVPNIPIEEEKEPENFYESLGWDKDIQVGVDVASKEESKTIIAVTTPKRGWVKEYYSGDKVWKRIFESDLQGDIVDRDAFGRLRKQNFQTSHGYRSWGDWWNDVTEYHLTVEDGMYYELIREAMLAPNPDSENKFDGISHLIDKET